MYPTPDAQDEGDVPQPMEFYNHYHHIFGPMLAIDEDVSTYRYVRLVALSEVNNNHWASVADFNLLDDAGQVINRSNWTVSADSQETAGENGSATNILDNNPNTIWHTEWYRQSPSHPHQLDIDLGSAYKLSGFKYLPRQNGQNGRIKEYQFFVSQDNSNWIQVATGTFPNSHEEQTVTITTGATAVDTGPEILVTGTDNQLYYRETLSSAWVNVPNSPAVKGVTVLLDGKIVGIGMNNELYYRDTLTSPWQYVPNSGSVIGIATMNDGKILGIGTNNQLYYRDTLTSAWQYVPNSGAVMGVTVLPDGKVVGVGMDHQLWYRDTLTSSWQLVPGSGSVTDVTVLPSGKIVGVGMAKQLWTRDTLTSGWVNIPNSAAVVAVTYGGKLIR